MSKTRLAVYPGSFDPVTNGHLDILRRGLALFDHIIVAVLDNGQKKPLFTASERVNLIEQSIGNNPRVTVLSCGGLLTELVKKEGAGFILRGLRTAADLTLENTSQYYNNRLLGGVETVCLMTDPAYGFVSSSAVKELFYHGGDLPDLVPSFVEQQLKAKFTKKEAK